MLRTVHATILPNALTSVSLITNIQNKLFKLSDSDISGIRMMLCLLLMFNQRHVIFLMIICYVSFLLELLHPAADSYAQSHSSPSL